VVGGAAPRLKSQDPTNPDVGARGRILPLRAPFATIALTAYLLFINDVVEEDQVLDARLPPGAHAPELCLEQMRCLWSLCQSKDRRRDTAHDPVITLRAFC
jgi:hypothetical protein